MRKSALLLLLFFLCSGCAFTRVQTPHLKATLQSLSEEQLSILDAFFRVLFVQSQGGYVLYGNKPLCIEAFAYREEGSLFLAKSIHMFSTELKRGALLWKELGLDKYCRNYHLHISDNPTKEWQDLLLLNKKELLVTLYKNHVLFQYILGPSLTPEQFLDQLLDPQLTFHSTLQNNKTLIGILLGYGTQNALFCSRAENIQEGDQSLPSNGFRTLEEESQWLKSKFTLSIQSSEEKVPLLPWFGCYDNQETQSLLTHYNQSRKKILKVLQSPHFLEEVFSRLFEEKVTLKPYNSSSRPSLPNRQELILAVSQSIWHSIAEKDPEYISSFLLGLQASENATTPLSEEEFCSLRSRYLASSSQGKDLPALRQEMAYQAGVRVWDHFKQAKELYSLPEILSQLVQTSSIPHLDPQTDKVLTHLHYLLYHL